MKVVICLLLAVCFAVVTGDTSCRRAKGTCRYTYQSCDGEFLRGKCSGPSNRQCCVPYDDRRCRSAGGKCQYTRTSCRNGNYVGGKCGGPSNRKCCVTAGSSSSGDTMTHSEAARQLSANSIGIWSSKKCSARKGRGCTSLDEVRSKNIREIIALKQRSRCAITITGGTEYYGHSRGGTYSHYNGYKLDISLGVCITKYIEKHFTRGPDRGSHPSYKDSSRNIIYYKESNRNHWDILYK